MGQNCPAAAAQVQPVPVAEDFFQHALHSRLEAPARGGESLPESLVEFLIDSEEFDDNLRLHEFIIIADA
jgi:hypothetical protein